jgi:alkanesulfonate monooxygenase SsuD/methylene tetrahydromethanopterin reductase-like flavin-dependent oxidoreductase (luciferase family)
MWVADYLLQPDPTAGPDQTEMLEAYTTLGFLAAPTQRVRLGIGAGYHGEEAQALDLPLPPVAERFERLEETLQIAIRMWTGHETPFEAKHYRLQHPVGSPGPARRPHPPFLIGGTGQRRTLRLVARYADACNLFDIPDGGRTVKHKLAVLADHCEAVGRPYEPIEKTLGTRLEAGESSDDFARRAVAAAELGIQHLGMITAGAWRPQALATLAAAIPQLRELRPRQTRPTTP